MENENLYEVLRPFGPSVARFTMPPELITTLNKYTDKIIKDKKKSEELDAGGKLAGQVTQEFDLEKEFIVSSGLLKFLGNSVTNWIKHSTSTDIKKFNIITSWVVRQFKNEYNPTHWHSGHISGVGYLKVPDTLGKSTQKNKIINPNGQLQLIHGSRQFLSHSTIDITPKVGDFYFFPNYLMHSVSPFTDSNDERRSISFNAEIDDNIYDVYKD
jgi:hypothetical protein